MVDFRSPVKVMIKLSKHSMPLVGWPNVENTNYVSTTHTQKCQMTTSKLRVSTLSVWAETIARPWNH